MRAIVQKEATVSAPARRSALTLIGAPNEESLSDGDIKTSAVCIHIYRLADSFNIICYKIYMQYKCLIFDYAYNALRGTQCFL